MKKTFWTLIAFVGLAAAISGCTEDLNERYRTRLDVNNNTENEMYVRIEGVRGDSRRECRVWRRWREDVIPSKESTRLRFNMECRMRPRRTVQLHRRDGSRTFTVRLYENELQQFQLKRVALATADEKTVQSFELVKEEDFTLDSRVPANIPWRAEEGKALITYHTDQSATLRVSLPEDQVQTFDLEQEFLLGLSDTTQAEAQSLEAFQPNQFVTAQVIDGSFIEYQFRFYGLGAVTCDQDKCIPVKVAR